MAHATLSPNLSVRARHPQFRTGTDAVPEHAGGLPEFVVDEFEAYLRCGILEHGGAHLACRRRGHWMVVAFSCKRRGFCPSASTAACPTSRLPVDDVLRSTVSALQDSMLEAFNPGREVHEQDPCGSTVRSRPHECDPRHLRHALLAVDRKIGTP
jgi:hypothetical protein